MSPEDLLNCSDAELHAFAAAAAESDMQNLFTQLWREIIPASAASYAGQAKSIETSRRVALAEAALRLAKHVHDSHFLIEAQHMMGRSLSANEDFERAIPFYRQVITSLEKAGDIRQAARLRLALIGVLLNADHYSEAFEVAGVAEKLFRDFGDDTGLARLYNNIANIYHRTDDHNRAFEYYSKCFEIFQRLQDERGIALSSFNLGNSLADIDEFEKSDAMYGTAIKLSEKLEWADLQIQAEYNRAYLHYLRGRYSDALDGFSRLRLVFEKAGSLRHYALCDLDEAEIYLQLNLSRDAAALATRGGEQFEKLGLKYEQAKCASLYGVALIQLRRYAEALEAFKTSQTIFETENNTYWMGVLDLYRAEVHLSLQRFWEAQALATQAKVIFDRLGISSKRIFSLVLLGRVALALNDLVAADRYTAEISEIIKDVKIPLVLFPYHALCGEIAERGRKWPEARRHYESATRELERHQARLHHDELRVTFFKGRHQAYEALVRLSLDSDDSISTSYAWCERARSRGLIELLSHYAPASLANADQSLLAKVSRLREELNIQYARAQPESRPIPASSNFETIEMKEQELSRTLRDVSKQDPEYASLQQVSIVTLESLQATLPERTTVIEYFTAGDEVLAFVISSREARVVRRLCPAARVLNQQERLGFQLEKFMLGKEYVSAHEKQILDTTRRHLHELHKYLVAPFISTIETPHLAIVPHGSLHFLPFHAFFDGDKHLIDDYEISYAPSASVLKYCLEKPVISDASPLLVGVADETVPLVHEELTRLKTLFPNGRVLLDESATREAFVEQSKAADFLHIATHALFRQDNPMFSSFKLADGWFTAFDLFSMVCQTNLVTLSGCQSGMSEVTGADDLVGLMRGFLYAGARSLLLSLWNVNDESTALLMAEFYQELQRSTSKSTALRSAMLRIREQYPNPFYWAPFLLAGNP